jgi:hypothetical protein
MIYIQDDGISYYMSDSAIIKENELDCYSTDSIYLFLENEDPILCGVVIQNTIFFDANPKNILPLYLHKGSYIVNIDVSNKKINYINSDLNIENHRDKEIADSIYEIEDSIYNELRIYKKQKDTLKVNAFKKLIQENKENYFNLKYNKALNRLDSYLALSFIYSYLDATINNIWYAKLKYLFDKLNPNLKKHNMYNECMRIFKTERFQLAEPPKSLWNDK